MSLASNLLTLATRIATELKSIRTLINGNVADLSALDTTATGSLVAAINEVFAAVGGAGATIDDESITTLAVWSSDKTDDEITTRVAAAVTALVGTAPAQLNTLGELSDALNDDSSLAATLVASIALKAPIDSPAFTGTPTAPTAAPGTNTTQMATTAFVGAAVTAGATPDASASVKGKVELSDNTEAATGTDTVRAMTPATTRHVTGDPETNFVTTFEAGLV